jgi:hypothetical protein
MVLPTRKLGKNGPEVTALGFGLMGLSAFYGTPEPDEERFKVLDRAHELGARNWDSADMYMDSEDLVGKWFKRTGKRNDIFLATKVRLCLVSEMRVLSLSGVADCVIVCQCCEGRPVGSRFKPRILQGCMCQVTAAFGD